MVLPKSAAGACPYCNAELPPLAAPPAGPRTPCPRCGEPVPSERFAVQVGVFGGPPPPAYAGGSLGKMRTLRSVLAIMAGMAVLTLVFALYTQQIRRQRDFKDRPDGNTELARKPAEL